ncbi:fluoride efflux transporter FluC [Spiractinospora alimapuensis]|uniref:fluoride efflux transporter FluC n=1 Tax=Spiractinospora alimapuensis TaxID=2820884 RepID=UPI002ED3122D
MTFLLVALGGALGAPSRYLIDRAWRARLDSLFPWGTFTANTLACGLLGLVATLVLPEPWFGFVAVGFLGALSTYSTFAFETVCDSPVEGSGSSRC